MNGISVNTEHNDHNDSIECSIMTERRNYCPVQSDNLINAYVSPLVFIHILPY